MNYEKLSPWLKDTTKKRYKKNTEMFKDSGWYKSRLVRNWMYFVMAVAFWIIGLFFMTANISTLPEDSDTTSMIVIGVIMLVTGILFDIYILIWEIWINKITNDLYGEVSNEKASQEAFDEWRNRQKELADEREKRYLAKKEADKKNKTQKQKEKENNLARQRELLKKEIEEDEKK